MTLDDLMGEINQAILERALKANAPALGATGATKGEPMDKADTPTRDVLDLLGVSRATLTNWRNAGTFPAHIR